MKKNAGDICFFAGLALAFVIQAVCGDFPEEVFAFPVNAAVLFFSVVLLVVLHREKPSSALCRYLASARTSLILFVCLALSCLILGLFSQTGGDLLGFRHVKYSWWFVYLMTAFMANILMVLITRTFRLRFLLNHLGLFLALAGSFAGSPDKSSVKMKLTNDPTADMYLTDFRVEYSPNGVPSDFQAEIVVDSKNASLKVNHPYPRTPFVDIYLLDYDKTSQKPAYCIVELVKQPWKYVVWIGVVMMMCGAALLFIQGVNKERRTV